MHPFIHIFGLKIPAYGVMLFLAALTAYLSLAHFSRREKLDFDKIGKLFFIAFLSALLGARLFYAVEHHLPPLQVFKVWEGGLDFFGGFIVAAAAVGLGVFYFRLPFWKVGDIAAVSLILAHSVGRLSCWLAGCCYGKPTDLPIGVVFPEGSVAPSGIPLYPTQLMEATGNFLGFLFLKWVYGRKPFDGSIFALYLIWYGTERFLLEYIRAVTPPIEGLGLTWNQLVCLAMVALGFSIVAFGFLSGKSPRK